MKLIFIYGSPAVGKLTVAQELAKLTGYKVFHNHLSIDAILPIFDFGTQSFGKLIDLIRVETITEAAHVGQDLIYTFCYAKDLDDSHIEQIAQAIESNGGEVYFVLLTADKDVLRKRVLNESRKQHGKAKTVELLDFFFDNYDLFSPVKGHESLIIDNTNVSPEIAAQKFVEHFDLVKI